MRWYRAAADQGDADAQRDLGYCYYIGEGVEEDKEEAAKCYREAAEQGDAEAQYQLGLCFLHGNGVTRYPGVARTWLQKAAKQGHAQAKEHLDGKPTVTLGREDGITIPSGLTVPNRPKDRYGNPVRQGTDPDSGLPLEVCLDKIDMPMVLCPAGAFKMGSEECADERPVHAVDVPAFYMAKYQVTNRQWKQFVDANDEWSKDRIKQEHHDGDYLDDWDGGALPSDRVDQPVTYVSWFAAKAFAGWAGGRLPTEAEWEKACRGGTRTEYCFGDYKHGGRLDDYAWYDANSDGETHPVGQKKSNDWGLYDMHGNVWEWCSSKKQSYPYRADDGREDLSDTGSSRVLRGGSFSYHRYDNCRSAYRYDHLPSFCVYSRGFRICASGEAPS